MASELLRVERELGRVTRWNGTSKQKAGAPHFTRVPASRALLWVRARARLCLPPLSQGAKSVLLKTGRLSLKPEPENNIAGEFSGCRLIIDGVLFCQFTCNVSNQSWV